MLWALLKREEGQQGASLKPFSSQCVCVCVCVCVCAHKYTQFLSDSLQPHELQPTRLLRPWGFPGKSTGVGCHIEQHRELYSISYDKHNGKEYFLKKTVLGLPWRSRKPEGGRGSDFSLSKDFTLQCRGCKFNLWLGS